VTTIAQAMSMPLIADFCLRLALGLAFLLLLSSWRLVPPRFFRTHCLVMLGLLVLGALDLGRAKGEHVALGVTIGAAVAAYLASAFWGLGLPRLAVPLTAMIASAIAAVEILDSGDARSLVWLLNGTGRLASAFLMGSTLTAMLLGHHYLTSPTMSIEPLKRFVRCTGLGLVIRAALAAAGLWVWLRACSGLAEAGEAWIYLAVRWGVGVGGVLLATILAWKTVVIRSTQSATGILYIGFILVLFGELTALVLSRQAGVIL
jgi:hypothetical protein